MFSKATANFVHQIDPEGSLIPVSRVNDSKKLVSMALVVKRNRRWFWQRPKYYPTDFTLSHLLQGDKDLHPEASETEFLTYQGTFGDNLSGKLDTEAGTVSIVLKGQGSSKLRSFFGKLKKEELDVTKLLQDSKDRQVDMQHMLVQQLKRQDVALAVVKERIITTSSCSVTMTKKNQCTVLGMLGLMSMLGSSVKVCVKDSANIEADSDISLEVPPGTVIAYSVLELEIRENGEYGICLQPGAIGGFDSPSWESPDAVDGRCLEELLPFDAHNEATDLHALAQLPKSTRCALFKGLQDIMIDRSALACRQSVLEDLCCGESLDLTQHDEGERTFVSAILKQLGLADPVEGRLSSLPPQMEAVHLLVSALEELPDETLDLLSRSTPEFLEAFDNLMSSIRESSGPLTVQSLPVLLQQNQNFQLAEQLLTTANVTMRRDANQLCVETGSGAELYMLLLYLSVHGLLLLAKSETDFID
ncbi:gasdermin-E-like isoform X1 [Takifugu flavidus]|uniref:Gasdermin-E n=1 Tax=Takifugu flavidus TaxID=433684 RepID=A0A5C6NGZ8_9TELE|nr:gasdermin-E-like isoform X1 [Takifugu flavidus]TWW65300.1 Gasdermin-E [Takifugu flavidus]